MKLRSIYILLLLMAFSATVFADSNNDHSDHLSIGLTIASWKPTTLDEKPIAIFKGVPGASPSYGLFFVTPWLGNLAIRVAVSEWHQNNLQDKCSVEEVRLRPLSIDLKNRILGGTKLSPYVSYGALFVWAAEKPIGAENFAEDKSQFGYGGSVGAGIDLFFSEHWALGVEYQYLYARFANPIGLTDDYRGPNISAKLFYIF